MLQSFGARLRQQREEQGIALNTIAEQTKIKLSLLDGLERDDVSHWPSGIFRRAFIRAYAHAIGLDPDSVVREFLEVHPEPAEVIAQAAAVSSETEGARTNGGPPTRLRYIVGSAIGSLSRLRRGAAGEDPAGADGARVNGPAAADPSRAPAVNPAGESDRVARANDAVVALPPPAPSSAGLAQVDQMAAVADAAPMNEPESFFPDLLGVARLCTELGRVEYTHEVQPLLEEAARILDAIGLIVWIWDPIAAELRPALVYGYSDKVLAQLPTVRRDADNPTAAAFRAAHVCVIAGTEHTSGALVVPLLTPTGCAGVLAFELPHRREQTPWVGAVATIFAASLAQLIGARPAEVRPQAEDDRPAVSDFTTPSLRATVRR